MKKALLFFFLCGMTIIGYAQTGCPGCVTNGSFTTPDGMPGINVSSFPAGCVGQYYQQDATIYLPGTFTYEGLPINLRSVVINSVTNIPTGLNWEKDGGGTTWTVNGSTRRGCFRICGTPTTAGVYNVSIAVTANVTVYGFPQSQNQTFSVPLTILALPASAGTITGTTPVCVGQTGVAYSVGAITDATSYLWTYSGTGATINGTGNAVTVNFSSSATSGNLTVQGQNSCGNGTASPAFAVTVNPYPSAAGTITGTATVCQGQSSVVYSVPTISNASSYIWNYTGTGASISGSGNGVTISFSSGATSGNLTVKGHNTCGDGTISANYPITVNPLPSAAGTISGSSAVCQGQSGVSYTVSVISNASTYIWEYSGTGATISGTGNTVTINFSSSATAGNLTVKGHNSCGDGTISANYPVTVNPFPGAAGGIQGVSSVCQGQGGVAYSAPAIADASSYVWTYSGTGATINGSGNAVTIDFDADATSGDLRVTGRNACGDGTPSEPFPVTVNPLPAAAGSIAGTTPVCQGQNGVVYSIAAIADADTYLWEYTGTGATINGSSNSVTVDFSTNATSGNLTVKGQNSCGEGGTSAAYAITVNPLPGQAGTISGTSPACQGQSGVAYSVPVISDADSYFWSYTGTGATIHGTSENITIDFAVNASIGELTVTGQNACGSGPVSGAFTILLNQIPDPAGTISGTTPVCQGQSGVGYSVPAIGFADSYIWNYSGTGATINGNTQNITIDFATDATSGDLTVMGHNDCGDGAVSEVFTVSVNPLPGPAGSVVGTTPVCQGQNGVIFSVPLVTDADTYVWEYSGTGATINGTSENISVDFAANATSGDLTVKGSNSCGEGVVSMAFPIVVNPTPGNAGPVSGSSPVCQGQTAVSYFIAPVSDADNYVWSYTGTGVSIQGNSETIDIDFSVSATSGNLSVYATNECGDGLPSLLFPVVVNPLPGAAGEISGTTPVCQGQSGITYSVTPITDADTYNWSYSGTGVTINGTSESITIDFAANATSGDLTVSGSNACGSGASSSVYSIIVNALPGNAGMIIGASDACQGQSGVSYSVPIISDADTYIWSYSGTGATISGNSENITIDFDNNATSGELSVYGENICGTGVPSTITITIDPLPGAPGLISGTSPVCQGQTGVNYSVPVIADAASYIWEYTGTGVTISGSSESITIDFANNATSGILTVKGHNDCGDGAVSDPYLISVNPLPGDPAGISGPSSVCQGQSGITYIVDPIPAADTYIWEYSGTGATITGTSNSVTIDFDNLATTGALSVKGQNTCGDGPLSAPLLISLENLPDSAGMITGDDVVCQGQNGVAYSVDPIDNAVSYVWNYSGNGATIHGTGNSITLDFSTAATAGELTVKGVSACGEGVVSLPFSVLLDPLPGIPSAITGVSPVCQGQSGVAYSVTDIDFADSYIWTYSGTGAVIHGTTNSVTVDFDLAATSGEIIVQGHNTCGEGPVSQGFPVVLDLLPSAAGTIIGSASVCQGQNSIGFSVPAIPDAATYIWEYSGTGAILNGNTENITIDFDMSATPGTLTVKGSNACGDGVVSPDFLIAIEELPDDAGSITGEDTLCQGQAGISYSVPPITNAVNYLWEYTGTGIIIQNNGNSITVDFTAAATSGDLTVKGLSACGEGGVSPVFPVLVNPLPDTALIISGTNQLCQGTSGLAYDIPAIDNADTYIWNYSGTGATINGTTNSVIIDFDGTATSGDLTVMGHNACGNGVISEVYPVILDPLPGNATSMSGPSYVCQGSNNLIYAIPEIANATNYVWEYTGTGITINGNSDTISINFSLSATSGTLTVYGENNCGTGGISMGHEIHVISIPDSAGVITGNDVLCQGDGLFEYSINPLPNTFNYYWDYTGTGVTLTNRGNEADIFFSGQATSGDLTVYGRNICGDGPVSQTFHITVNTIPLDPGVISGPDTVCQGQTGIVYSLTAIPNADTYIWNYTGSGATISGTSESITLDIDVTATSGILTVFGRNACGDGNVSADYNITVNPLPDAAGAIAGAATVCQGQSGVGYAVPVIGNAGNYIWSYSGTGATINGNSENITIDFDNNATAGDLTVIGHNDCGNGTVSEVFSITVNPLPGAASSILGATEVCQNQLGVGYSLTPVTDADTYLWNYSGTGVIIHGTAENVLLDFTSSATSGELTVSGQNACGEGLVSEALLINVNPLPAAAGIISGSNHVCPGETGTGFAIPVIPDAITYTWSYTGTGATINGSSESITIDFDQAATGGDLTVFGSNACGDGILSEVFSITIDPLPDTAGIISGPASVCQGQNGVIYTIPVIDNADTYEWNYSGTGATINGTSDTVTIDFSNNATNGELTVTGRNACGTGVVSATWMISVAPLPGTPGTIFGPATVCIGQSGVAYSVPVIADADTYVWNYTGSGATISGAGENIIIDFDATATSGELTVYGQNTCGDGIVSNTLNITVNLYPDAAGAISGTDIVCQGQSGVAYSLPTIQYADAYVWSYSGTGVTINGNSENVTIDFSTTATSGELTVLGTNSCGNGSVSAIFNITVNPLPDNAGIITGAPTVCQGQSGVLYSVPLIANADAYVWNYTGTGVTITGAGQNILLDFDNVSSSGELTVYASNNCGDGVVSSSFTITVDPLPGPAGTITGNATVCQGQNSVPFSIPAVANAGSYMWFYSGSGATINGTGENVTIDFAPNATAGDLTVYGNNSCGNGTTSAIFSIAVNPLPGPAAGISGSSTVCQGVNGIVFSVPLITDAVSYTWAYSGTGATIHGTSENITIDFSASATSGSLTVSGTNACGNGTVSPVFIITVNPLPDAAGIISGPASVCQGQTVLEYTVPAISNADNYVWSYTGTGVTINGAYDSITVDFASNATSGVLTVLGNNNCGDGLISADFNITVNPLPLDADMIAGSDTVCLGDMNITYSIPAILNADHYEWVYTGTGATINVTNNVITIDFANNATSGELTVTGQNACGLGGTSAPYAITVLDCHVGIIDNNVSLSVTVTPNPADGWFSMMISAPADIDGEIWMTNVAGQLISREQFYLLEGANVIRKDVSNLAEGIYYLSIISGDFRVVKKLVVSR